VDQEGQGGGQVWEQEVEGELVMTIRLWPTSSLSMPARMALVQLAMLGKSNSEWGVKIHGGRRW
jgi:hypothetical protein